jgi:hypothetical protein
MEFPDDFFMRNGPSHVRRSLAVWRRGSDQFAEDKSIRFVSIT